MGKTWKCGCFWWFFVFFVGILVLVAAALTIRQKFFLNSSAPNAPDSPGETTNKYAEALKIAMQFFDAQKGILACHYVSFPYSFDLWHSIQVTGKLVHNEIPWRRDSALNDGSDVKADLSKGMYDAGDAIKFGFPMAYTATILSWVILEYGDQMDTIEQLEPAQNSLKWITDYLINAHPKKDVLYIQVGDAKVDHECWQRPETMTEKRPVTQVNTSYPGTDVAAETAAAMASASLVFKKTDSTYSDTLLEHAKQLFEFADDNRESYSVSIPDVAIYYNSTGYGDELLWAASWLYHATGKKSYLEYVTGDNGDKFANFGSPSWFSWDNNLAGAQVLLSRVSFFNEKESSNNLGLQNYRQTAEALICSLLPDSLSATDSRTAGGLVWFSQWDALQHPVAAAFLTVLYGDYMLTSRTKNIYCSGILFTAKDLRKFAMSQADYLLGDNPMKLSYLIGYGDDYPQFVHHRGASIPADAETGCKGFKWLESKKPNPNVAIGAMVGGPFKNDSFIDSRNNSMQTEPTTYNTALAVGLLSGLVTKSSVVKSFS